MHRVDDENRVYLGLVTCIRIKENVKPSIVRVKASALAVKVDLFKKITSFHVDDLCAIEELFEIRTIPTSVDNHLFAIIFCE